MIQVLIIGARRDQLPAILKAKSRGYKVIVVDNNPIKEALNSIDLLIPVDFEKEEDVLTAISGINFDGVMTMQSDAPIRTVGRIVDKYHLPGVGYEISRICTDKSLLNSIWSKGNVHIAKQYVTRSYEQALLYCKELSLPIMIKPIDSSGSLGASKVNSYDELSKAYKNAHQYSKSGTIVLEEFLEGTEFGAQVLVYDGECHAIFLHNDLVDNFVPIGHSMPCTFPLDYNIKELINNAIKTIGIKTAICNLDLIMTIDGPKIIELAVRMGATCLPDLVEMHSGVDWVDAALDISIGIKPDVSNKREIPCTVRNIEIKNNGILRSIFMDQHLFDHQIHLVDFEVQPGDKVKKIPDRVGRILVTGDTLEDAENRAKNVRDSIQIDICHCWEPSPENIKHS